MEKHRAKGSGTRMQLPQVICHFGVPSDHGGTLFDLLESDLNNHLITVGNLGLKINTIEGLSPATAILISGNPRTDRQERMVMLLNIG